MGLTLAAHTALCFLFSAGANRVVFVAMWIVCGAFPNMAHYHFIVKIQHTADIMFIFNREIYREGEHGHNSKTVAGNADG